MGLATLNRLRSAPRGFDEQFLDAFLFVGRARGSARRGRRHRLSFDRWRWSRPGEKVSRTNISG